MMIDILFLYFLSFLIIWQFGGYQLLMSIIAIISKPKEKNYGYQIFVSIIVPAYNEEKVITDRINNLLNLDYPKDKYEIIVVESGSTDNTSQIVKDIINNRKNGTKMEIKLLQENRRKGKASAINFGKKHAKGDIVLITDANSIFDKNVLREIAPHFEDQKTGGVGGKYLISNEDDNIISFSESFYWNLESIMRTGESVLDSTFFHGEINAWRKTIVNADTNMLSEDLDMAIQIRRKGYRIKYEPRAIVYEPSARTPQDQITQKKRRAIGRIQCLKKHWDYFLLPRDLYASLIFPSHKLLDLFSPFTFLVVFTLYAFVDDVVVIATHIISTLMIFTIVFVLLVALKSKIAKSTKSKSTLSLSSVLKIVYYVLFNEYIILLAWKDCLFRKYSVLWEKVESTR